MCLVPTYLTGVPRVLIKRKIKISTLDFVTQIDQKEEFKKGSYSRLFFFLKKPNVSLVELKSVMINEK